MVLVSASFLRSHWNMAVQDEKSDVPTYGDRFPGGHDDKFFELYQKAVELGTWDVEKVIAKAPVEKDREQWENMNREQRLLWSRTVAGFLDGENNVAVDATKLVQMVDSPYLDNTANKEAFYTTLQFEETKHTQFCAWYAENVVPDEVFPRIGRGSRHGLSALRGASGFGNLTEKEEDLLNTAVYTKKPHDIARAAANYGLHVEGLGARNGFNRMKTMAQETPLPTWISTFELISTDEGRHITGQLELVKELVDKEKEGKADYQGVGRTVWTQLKDDIELLAEGSIRSVYQLQAIRGEELSEEEIEQRIDQQVEARMRYVNDMYRRTLDLPEYDEQELRDHMRKTIRQTQQELEDEGGYLEEIERSQNQAQELIDHEDGLGFAGDD